LLPSLSLAERLPLLLKILVFSRKRNRQVVIKIVFQLKKLKVGDGGIAKYFIIDIHIVASNYDGGRNKIKQTAKQTT
jgi:hypothetical protein